MTRTTYDAIVIGCGGFGSAALYWLSRRGGLEVLGLEQFRLGHDRGSSDDHSRVIRLAYHQSEYAALAPRAYDCWREVEHEAGTQLVITTGSLIIEHFGSRDVEAHGVRDLRRYTSTMKHAGIEFEELSGHEVNGRWPQFRLTSQERAIYQKDGGVVDARRAGRTHVSLARRRGCDVLEESAVESIRILQDSVEVKTAHGTFCAASLIVTAGAWTRKLLKDAGLDIPLQVTQEQVTYYSTPNVEAFSPKHFPVWLWHGEHSFYGFPIYGEAATKMGQHNGGPPVTTETRDFTPDPVRQRRYHEFLAQRIPEFFGPELYTKTCLYTSPPDQNLIIAPLPAHPHVALAVGAGHGFKFASLIGRILAELAVDGGTGFPIEAFSLSRPALTDPDFGTAFHR